MDVPVKVVHFCYSGPNQPSALEPGVNLMAKCAMFQPFRAPRVGSGTSSAVRGVAPSLEEVEDARIWSRALLFRPILMQLDFDPPAETWPRL